MGKLAIKNNIVKETVKWAKKYFPGLTIRFRTKPKIIYKGEECDALFDPRPDGTYILWLSRRVDANRLVDSILHELGHILDNHRNGPFEEGDHDGQHSDTWGIEHSRIYTDYWRWRNDTC